MTQNQTSDVTNVVERRSVPENFGNDLAAQPLILRILAPQDFRPVRCQFAAHAGEVAAGTWEDKGHLGSVAERLALKKDSLRSRAPCFIARLE